jgi:cytochrome bd ubiquinol oxidase subunit II
MPSTLEPGSTLTVLEAASSAYTLKAMTIITAIFLPLVLLYQGWTYWVFRKRVVAA